MISQLIINTLTGASTGYITNNIAIKMLFKKYFGRFGGMIEDTHEEFVENISALIEKDLINHSTLADEFQSDTFHFYIQQLIEDMFTNTLLEHSTEIKNIKGVYDTRDNLLHFLDEHKIHRKNIKSKLTSKPLSDAISHQQLLHFSQSLAKTIHSGKNVYLQELLPLLQKFQLNDFITEEMLERKI